MENTLKALALCSLLLLSACDAAEEAGVYDPRNYGAVVNDGIDDVPAIEQAIHAAANSGGGVVLLARGQWTISRLIELGGAQGVSVKGAGVDVTQLVRLDASQPIFRVGVRAGNQSLSDMTLNGGAGVGNAPLFDALAQWIGGSMVNVKFTNYRNGLRLVDYIYVQLQRLQLQGRDLGGFAVQAGIQRSAPNESADLTIADCLIQGSSLGVVISDADAVFMRNTDISADYIDLAILPSTRSNNHTFSDNFFDTTRFASVVLGGVGSISQVLFDGNWIASSPFGVQIHSTARYSDISFNGGRVFNIGSVGMLVDAPVASLLIQGVQFSAVGGDCIHLTGNSRAGQFAIAGNAFRACGREVVR